MVKIRFLFRVRFRFLNLTYLRWQLEKKSHSQMAIDCIWRFSKRENILIQGILVRCVSRESILRHRCVCVFVFIVILCIRILSIRSFEGLLSDEETK